MKKSIKRQNFTLIEMLVVIGIAGLLFTLMGPAFSRMTRGNAVESLASGLKLGMERARALAVSQRRSVAVLLPNKVSDKEKAHYNFQRGGFLLGFVTQNNSGDYVFDGVIPDADWTNRGKEAYLTAISDNKRKLADFTAEKPAENFEKTPAGMSNLLCNVLEVRYDAAGNKDTCRGIIFSPYGDVKVPGDKVELFFYITAADVEDGLILRLNKLSGKVEFVENED